MKEHRDWFKYLKWFLIVLAVLGVLLVAAVWGLRYYVRRGMTAAEIAEMDRFFSEPVEIPEEWSKVEPFPEDVVLAAERLRTLCTEPGGAQAARSWRETLERLGRGEDLEPGEREEIEETLQSRGEYFEALIVLASLPGYEMDAFPGNDDEDRSTRMPGYSRIDQILLGQRYLLLRAHSLGESGDCAQAFDTCIATLRLFHHHPASTTLNHMLSVSVTSQVCRTILHLASICDDEHTLERALEELGRVSRERSSCDMSDPPLLDLIGILREYARDGGDVDLSSGQTRADLMHQRVEFLNQETGARNLSLDAPIIGRITAESLYRISIPVMWKAREDWLASLPDLDLTRLALASRIYELRTGEKPTGMDDLVPDYFPEPLVDPLSKMPYLWSERWESFYSVGLNKQPEVDSMTLDEDGDLVGGDDTAAIPGQGIVTGHVPRPSRRRPRPR